MTLMALVKKLSKIGRARGLLLTQDSLELLGVGEDDELALEFIGDTLVVRRHDGSRPDVMALLTAFETITDTIRLKPEYAHLADRLRPESRQRMLLHLLHHGPTSAADISRELNIPRMTVGAALRSLKADGLVDHARVESGVPLYEIVRDRFED